MIGVKYKAELCECYSYTYCAVAVQLCPSLNVIFLDPPGYLYDIKVTEAFYQ